MVNKLALAFFVISLGITVFAINFDYRNPIGFSSVPKVKREKNERIPNTYSSPSTAGYQRTQNAYISVRDASLGASRGFRYGK